MEWFAKMLDSDVAYLLLWVTVAVGATVYFIYIQMEQSILDDIQAERTESNQLVSGNRNPGRIQPEGLGPSKTTSASSDLSRETEFSAHMGSRPTSSRCSLSQWEETLDEARAQTLLSVLDELIVEDEKSDEIGTTPSQTPSLQAPPSPISMNEPLSNNDALSQKFLKAQTMLDMAADLVLAYKGHQPPSKVILQALSNEIQQRHFCQRQVQKFKRLVHRLLPILQSVRADISAMRTQIPYTQSYVQTCISDLKDFFEIISSRQLQLESNLADAELSVAAKEQKALSDLRIALANERLALAEAEKRLEDQGVLNNLAHQAVSTVIAERDQLASSVSNLEKDVAEAQEKLSEASHLVHVLQERLSVCEDVISSNSSCISAFERKESEWSATCEQHMYELDGLLLGNKERDSLITKLTAKLAEVTSRIDLISREKEEQREASEIEILRLQQLVDSTTESPKTMKDSKLLECPEFEDKCTQWETVTPTFSAKDVKMIDETQDIMLDVGADESIIRQYMNDSEVTHVGVEVETQDSDMLQESTAPSQEEIDLFLKEYQRRKKELSLLRKKANRVVELIADTQSLSSQCGNVEQDTEEFSADRDFRVSDENKDPQEGKVDSKDTVATFAEKLTKRASNLAKKHQELVVDINSLQMQLDYDRKWKRTWISVKSEAASSVQSLQEEFEV